ncbi:MAG TPA: hypothetical protein VJ508_15505, partial [Saprospiraceae bacterium]|nr:hypothetical protein [Saprospiraceae bacterium]
NEYVKQGGTLIVFGQQHGYEFSVLPVPEEPDGIYRQVTGYGWSEDQSCRYASSYIETWHQIFSGQSKSTPNINVDGYFTNYPSNAAVLLRRTANGQPDLIMYEHGQGKVIVTSMYSDYALKINQAFSEEVALVRDIISWAKKPAQLPEVKPGQSVTVSVSVTNSTTSDSSSLKILIYNPDRTTVFSEQTMSVPIPAGQTVTIPVTCATGLDSALGVYHIDYRLLDGQSSIIQPQAETDSGRFVVSNPAPSEYKPLDLLYSVNTSTEFFVKGESIPFTVTLWNNSDAEKRLRLYWDWFHTPPTVLLDEVTVEAHGTVTKNYIVAPYSGMWSWFYGDSLRLWVHFFEENGAGVTKPSWVHADGESWPYAGSSSKGVSVIYPSAAVSLNMDKPIYANGETVKINASVKNTVETSWQPTVRIAVYDPRGISIFDDSKTLILPPSGTAPVSSSFTLPPNSTVGSYGVNVNVQSEIGGYGGSAYATFELAESKILTSPNLASGLNAGNNTLPFTVTNTGKISVSTGTLNLNLEAPDGSTVFSGSQPFSLAV